MLLLGRCGVLIVDMASVPTHSGPLIERIHAQFPDVVVVVAGSRDDEAALAGLVSDGLIYRYMHKPLSAKRAGMFLNAAIQQYVERRGRRDFAPLLPLVGRLPERVHARYWAIPAAVIVAVVLGVVLLSHDDPTRRCSHRRSRRNRMRSNDTARRSRAVARARCSGGGPLRSARRSQRARSLPSRAARQAGARRSARRSRTRARSNRGRRAATLARRRPCRRGASAAPRARGRACTARGAGVAGQHATGCCRGPATRRRGPATR